MIETESQYKTHLKNPEWHPKSIKSIMLCKNTGYSNQNLTTEIEKVTCKKCLAIIQNQKER